MISLDDINLMDLNQQETAELAITMGEPAFRGRQLYKWIHQKGAADFSEMTDLPLPFREKLKAGSVIGLPQIITKQVSSDGTTKYLFGLTDGNTVESVFLPHDYGLSVCVSSQVGCRMGCGFCASTLGGLVRDLTGGEMLSQVMAIGRDTGKRIGSIVIMGSGEPMDNLTEVIKFITMLNDKDSLNIGARHITLSTCGVVPGILALADEKLQITLSVSLHAPNDEIRDAMMPVNKKYPVSALMEACRSYVDMTGRRITFEYALIDGVNDSVEQAIELGRLLKGILCHVNLIPLNRVAERNLNRSKTGNIKAFQEALSKTGTAVTVRREMGTDIDAACGQLRRRMKAEK